jgi:DNA-binding transcriptional ArsR family regulator
MIMSQWSDCQRAVLFEWSEAIRIVLPKEPTRAELSLTKILYALSDEVRLGIVRQLDRQGPSPCGAFEVDRPKSSLSHHFRVLRESGIVATTRQGTSLMNRLRRDDLNARFPNLLDAVLGQASGRNRKR